MRARIYIDGSADEAHTLVMPTTHTAPFGHIIDSRTGDQIRPATEQEWRDHARGRHDPSHFHITSDGPLRVMRLVFCDGPNDRA